MLDFQLFKKNSTYKDKDGNEKTATNFYLKCGDELIPIEVRYYEGKDGTPDPNYRSRKSVLSAFAEVLPDKEKK